MDRGGSDFVRAALNETIGARYEILDLHGQGAMGVVYCARERALERLVAIKVLTPERAPTAQARDRFRREARLAAALSHPSIVPVFDFGESHDFAYIVMAFVRGESLGRRLRHEGRLPANVTRRILLDLSDALDHAHSRGIIHRDIKPENVLIAAGTGRVLLADFGIAKALGDGTRLTQSGSWLGTPEYMSPEAAAGERDVDGRSDLYSLGAVGYTMLAGRPPHQSESIPDLMARIITDEPVPLRELAPDAPHDLVGAIARCLEKNPDRRWPDASALHRALAREPAADEPEAEELRAVTGFGAFLFLVVFAAIGFAVSRFGSDRSPGAWLALLTGLLVASGFVIYARGIAAGGYPLREVLRVSMWPPKWWGLWWPEALRRPADVWECLPTSARLTRVLLSVAFTLTLVWLLAGTEPAWTTPIMIGLWGAVLLVIGIALARWQRIGFNPQHASRLLFGPTVGATFWNQPQVSAVLVTRADPNCACPTPIPDTVRAILHAIEDAVPQLIGRARERGSAAAEAARLLVEEIERLDADIESLAQDADPEELARVERRLAQLHKVHRDARQHLEEYARIMRGQADLIDVKRLEREDAHGTLRAIWTVIDQIREQSGRGTSDPDLVQRLNELASAVRQRPQRR
jgi:predicted Ser/Thr protein kinase